MTIKSLTPPLYSYNFITTHFISKCIVMKAQPASQYGALNVPTSPVFKMTFKLINDLKHSKMLRCWLTIDLTRCKLVWCELTCNRMTTCFRVFKSV